MSNTEDIFAGAGEEIEEEEASFGDAVWGTSEAVRGTTIGLRYQPGLSYGPADRREIQKISDTGENVLRSFDYLAPDQLYELQLQLLLNGFDTRKIEKVLWGQPDPASYKAFAKAVGTAARSGKTLEEVLGAVPANADSLSSLAGRGSGSGGGRSNVVQVSAPEDLEAVVREGFIAATGYGPTDEQVKSFVSTFQARERGAQPDTSGGGTFNITAPPSPTVAARNFAEQQAPGDVKAFKQFELMDALVSALGGR